MSETKELFDKDGYVVVNNLITKKQCDSLVKRMFLLKETGSLFIDTQCPLSESVYCDPIFENVLQKFSRPISEVVGKKLLPTYSYARIYRPGEILEKHRDRFACEISATLTLGYESDSVWPIYFDEEKEIPLSLEVGEMAVYKGCEVIHWRTEFKGSWHVQAFFHYVDADGPYKDRYMDGRR